MSLLKRIESEYVLAYKAKDTIRVAALRLLKAAIKNRQVELGREPTDEEILELVARQVKQRKESIDQFRRAGRDELADKEQGELEVLSAFLPQQLSDEELAQAVDAAVAQVGAASPADMGKVMGVLMAAHKGRIDGQKASALVRARLTS